MWRIPRYAGLKSNNLKKLNGHSFFGNPFYYWLSGLKVLYCLKQGIEKLLGVFLFKARKCHPEICFA